MKKTFIYLIFLILLFNIVIAIPWDISTAEFDTNGTLTTNIRAIFVSPNGDYIYGGSVATDSILQYSITNGDISTASYTGDSVSVASQETVLNALVFNDDGTKMYIVGNQKKIFQYNLTVAWNVSSASYSGNNVLLTDYYASFGFSRGMGINSDSTVIFISDHNKFTMQLDLSTSGDITTTSYSGNNITLSNVTDPRSIFIGDSNSKMYVVSEEIPNSSISQYNLSTPNDLTSASYVQTFYTGTTNQVDSAFKSDGTFFYIITESNGVVLQYSMPTTDTCTYSGSGDWLIDASDNCTLSTNTSLPSNQILITGTGLVTITADIGASLVYIGEGSTVYIPTSNGGSLYTI